MSVSSRVAPRLRCLRLPLSSLDRHFFTTSAKHRIEDWPQRTPLGDYYETILKDPTPLPFDQKPEEPPNSADPKVLPEHKKPLGTNATTRAQQKAFLSEPLPSQSTSPPTPSPPPATAAEKARIIFGSRLASPNDMAERAATKESKSTYVGNVLVPPRPEEPDNCCMSGCVNCVWDLFREDMEEWTAKKEAAEAQFASANANKTDTIEADSDKAEPIQTLPSGVEVGDTKIAKDLWDEDLFHNVPVGIREFMKQEKRLKERHEREGTSSD